MSAPQEVTLVLSAIRRGEAESDDLLPLVYDELRQLAQFQLQKLGPQQTLQATGLVHEAYMKLLGGAGAWEDRRHFFGSCARAMRNILVDAARTKHRLKRGGNWHQVTLGDTPQPEAEAGLDLLALDAALAKLEHVDPRQHEIVMLRYFSGLTIEATAEALDIGTATVDRQWRFARAWLHREISQGTA